MLDFEMCSKGLNEFTRVQHEIKATFELHLLSAKRLNEDSQIDR